MQPTIADVLTLYGIATFKDFHRRFGGAEKYMREIYTSRIPVSKKLALRIREFTGGKLSADLLFSLGPDGDGKKRK